MTPWQNIQNAKRSTAFQATQPSSDGIYDRSHVSPRHKDQPQGSTSNDVQFSVCNASKVPTGRTDRKEKMNYDALFLQASRGVNGALGGCGESGGNGAHPASPGRGYSTPLTKIGDGGFYRHDSNNTKSLIRPLAISLGGGVSFSSSNGQELPAQKSRSSPYSQVPVMPQVSIPAVHLTSSPDSQGLNLATIDKEWERRGSKSSNRSHNSKSSGKGSNRFLGVSTGSAWTRWSRDRRASYRRRIEKLEREEPAPTSNVVRISTPVKKARQEGLKFVHPDLEARYLSEDDLNELRRHKQQQVHAMRVIERNRRNKFRLKTEVKLNADQWHMLQEFWDHAFFVRARYLGLLVSVIAFVLMVVSITSHSWVKHSE